MSKEQTLKIVDLLRYYDQKVSDELVQYVKSIGQWGN